MPKTGTYKTGEAPTGDIAQIILTSPTQTLSLSSPTQLLGQDVWVLDGSSIESNTMESATWQRLTLRQRVQTSTLTNTLRALKSDEGQVDVLNTDTGGFTAVGRANGDNTFELIPPVYRQPLRESGNVHVARYEEDLVSQTVDDWDVELELVKTTNRTDSPSISETAGANDWELVTPLGTIATDRVDADFLGTGTDGAERFELIMRLTFDQAHVWEAAFNQQAGVRVRVVPDATNEAVDDTAGTGQTVNVTAPTSGSEVPTGDYVVLSWESVRLNEAYQEVSAVLAISG